MRDRSIERLAWFADKGRDSEDAFTRSAAWALWNWAQDAVEDIVAFGEWAEQDAQALGLRALAGPLRDDCP